jgi:HSP20 family protein
MNWPAKRTFSEPIRWDPFEEIRKTQEHLNLLFEDLMPMKKWGRKMYLPLHLTSRTKKTNLL